MKPKEQRLIKVEALFVYKIWGLAVIKMLDRKVQNATMLNLKFIYSLATLDVTNISLETIVFDPKDMIGILDLRLIGYY